MPLRHSPPKTTESGDRKLSAPINIQYGSAPNLATIEAKASVSRSNKRKYEDELSSFMQEIRELLKSSTAQTEIKFLSLQKSMDEIVSQNAEIKKTLDFTTKQYDDVMLKIDSLESERKSDRYICQLEDKVQNMERLLSLSKIEIRNISKLDKESKDELCNLVKKTVSVLDIPLQHQDIKDIYRIKKKNGTSPIIVDFVSVTTKDLILQNLRNFNHRNNQDRLNTKHINLAILNLSTSQKA
ncbi:hypothetical protein PYW08_012932 [Mythimna loreyi]|uniref:Uncharacterized protein n=1 Tax=Mythimna loreyi TaxID=667449 RepID=A0ACC2Q1C6_9NEOP|nr:hypothetical protein PYW08_012932 [Mythimna loreyi]